MPAPEELQQDKDFMTATPADQIKYLSSTDPEFKAAHADDQAAYLAHVTKQPTGAEAMQPKPGIIGKLDTATDYISKGLEPVDKAVTEALAPKPTGDVLPTETREVPKAAARNIYGAGKTALKTLTGLPSALGHAFGDEATPEEKAQYSDFEKQNGEKPGTETSGLKRIGLGVGRFLGADQLRSAVDTYSNPATRPTAEQALSVAEPAIQEGAGTVLGMEAAGKIAGVPSRESMPATSDLVDKGVRGMGKAYQAAREVAPEAGAAIGGTVGALKGPGGAAYGMYTGGRVGKILQKITPEGNAAAEFGLSVEDRNVQRLEKAVTTADKAADKAAEDHSIYAASEERGPIDPAVNPAYKKSMEALKKATDAQAEAHFHLQEAKRAAKEAEASKGATEGQGKDITPEEVAAARPETATPTDEELKTRQEKLMGEMEKQAGVEKPATTPENVKLPGQVQPETVPQAPTEVPRVDETTQMRPLAGNKGTIVGRSPRLLGEGTPEAAPASPESPKTPLGEILPPEKPTKPGRLGTLKAEGGKVVDAETGLQQKLEEGLQGTPKPVALKPLGTTEATPLGGKIETPEPVSEAPKEVAPKEEPKKVEEKIERTPEDLSKIKKLMADHTDQELLREAKRRGIDESQYDMSKREGPNRHRVDRDKLVNDLVDKLPEDEKDKLVNLSDKFDSKDDSTWTNAEKSNLNRAQRARAIMQEHTGGPKEVSGGSQSADVAGSEESSAKDRAHFVQAKQELPNGTVSEQLLRAQELKEKATKTEPKGAIKPAQGESAEEMARRGVSVEEPLNVAQSANDYNKSQGLPEIKPEKSAKSSRAAEIGQAYDDMKHNPTDEVTKKSYDALIDDTKKQWDYATKEMGIKIVPTDEDPYASHEEMMKDLIDNKRLKVYRGGTPLEAGHNLSEVDPNTGENYNTMFRAVHDIFGHAAQGHDFSEAGEESAWNTHRQMMSPEAIPAMTTETRAQTSSYFKNGGKFPDQKSGILPDFAMEKGEPVDHSKAIAELHNEGGGSTYNPQKGDMGGADAYAVPMHPELSRSVEGEKVTPEQIKKYMEIPEVKKALDSDPNLSVGTWANEGKSYLDLSATIANKDEAVKLGKDNNQKAITYLKTREDIPTGGTGTGTPLEPKPLKAVKDMTDAEKEELAAKGQSGASGKADKPTTGRVNRQGEIVGEAEVTPNKNAMKVFVKAPEGFRAIGDTANLKGTSASFAYGKYEKYTTPAEAKAAAEAYAKDPNNFVGGRAKAPTSSGIMPSEEKPTDTTKQNTPPENFSHVLKPEGKAALKGIKDDSTIIVTPEGAVHHYDEYNPSSEQYTHSSLFNQLLDTDEGERGKYQVKDEDASDYDPSGDYNKFQEAGGIRAFTTGPEEAGIEIHSNAPAGTIAKALRVADALGRPDTTLEVIDSNNFKTLFSKSGSYEQIKNAVFDWADKNGKEAYPGEANTPEVSGASGKEDKPMPTGDQLIKKYGESDGDPAHTAFILPDGRGVALGAVDHDTMLGGKATDKVPRRDQFVDSGNIRIRPRAGGKAGREFSISIPESGITEDQLAHLNKMAPQLSSGTVMVEIGKRGGDYKSIPYGEASKSLESTLRDLAPVKEAEKTLPDLAEKHLTPEERQGVTKSPQQQERFIQRMESMPELQEWKDAAQKGAGERKWYQRSSQAFDAMSKEAPEYFDQPGDRDKFVGMLAAGSPQQSVAMNMREALRVWTSYVDNGRPTGAKLEKLLSKPSDQGGFTLLGAKIPNAMKALAGESLWPDITKNKNFKVPSFRDNLTGVLDRVTNDGWMALFSGLDAKDISSAHSYHPISVMTRAAAEELGWKPAEAQAAVWAFIKTLTEKGVDASEDPHEMRQYSEDFSDIILHDPETRNLLKEMGVDHAKLDERLAREVERKPKPESGSTSPTGEDSSRRAVERVEAARGKGTIPAAKTGLLKFGEPEPDEATSFKIEDLKSGDNPVKDHTYEYTESGTLKSVTARDAEGNSVATVVATPEESDPNTWTVGFSKATETGKGIGLGAYAKLAEEAKAEAQRTGQAITLQGDKPDQMSAAARRTWVKLGEQGYDVQWAKDNRPSIVLRGSGLKKLGSSEKTTALGKIQK